MPQAVIDCSSSGNNVIVAARADVRVVVYSYYCQPTAAVTAKWHSGTSTIISGPAAWAANGGVERAGRNRGYLFATEVGEALNLHLSTGTQVGGDLWYEYEP